MADLEALVQQRAALDQQIRELQKEMRQDAVRRAKALAEAYGLSERDIFPVAAPGEKRAVQPKYRDPVTGKTWSGRGKAPKWLEGKNRSEFAI